MSALAAEQLYGETSGSGNADEPLVMLHGWGLNLRVFDQLRAELLAYCKRDTLAMVEVHRALARLVVL